MTSPVPLRPGLVGPYRPGMVGDEPSVTVTLELDAAGNVEASCSFCGHLGVVPADEVGAFAKGGAGHLQLHATVLALGPAGLRHAVARG